MGAAPGEAGLTTGEGAGEIKRLVIGIDISKSYPNPLIVKPEFAAKVAQRLSLMIKPLGFRSEVMVRTFGTFSASQNTFRFDAVVSSRYRPERLAGEIELLIANTPDLVKRGVWVSQMETNIIAFLENMGQVVDCSTMDTVYVLVSDGIEESEYADLKRRLPAGLPPPGEKLFAGCRELLMLGIGVGTDSPMITDRLRSEWQYWAAAAGFEKFTGLNDW